MISTGSPINKGGATRFSNKIKIINYTGKSPVVIELSIESINNIYVTWCNILQKIL